MARIIYSARELSDFEQLIDYVVGHDLASAGVAVERIREAISILEHHPLIGRPVEAGLRELIVSRGRSGYLALYRFLELEDVVLVLAIRHQRDAGYIE